MAFYVEILDDSGVVTATAEAHECVGDLSVCETPAVCDDHGDVASPENPVYTFVTDDDFFGAACRNGMDGDFSRLIERPERAPVGPCPCECNRGQFCGGCGHAGCGRR